MIPELRIGARDPEGGRLRSVRCVPAHTRCSVDVGRDLVVVNAVDGLISLEVSFR
jgi:hypothetical protein